MRTCGKVGRGGEVSSANNVEQIEPHSVNVHS